MKISHKLFGAAGFAVAMLATSNAQAAVLYAFDGTVIRPDGASLVIWNIKWNYITPDFINLATGDSLAVLPSQLTNCTATKFVGAVAGGPVGCGQQNFVRSFSDSFINFRITDASEASGTVFGFMSARRDAFITFDTYNDSFPAGPSGGSNIGKLVVSLAPVPEPASWAMMIAGFGLVGAAMRRQAAKLRFA